MPWVLRRTLEPWQVALPILASPGAVAIVANGPASKPRGPTIATVVYFKRGAHLRTKDPWTRLRSEARQFSEVEAARYALLVDGCTVEEFVSGGEGT